MDLLPSGRIRRLRLIGLGASSLAFVAALACAPADRAGDPAVTAEPVSLPPALEPWRDRFRRLQQERSIAGLSVAISHNGETVWAEGFGSANLEQDVPMAADTVVRVGSVSKAITAVGLGVLLDRGALDLDAEIQTYVPDFPRKEHPITVRQVAGHTAGIRHYRGAEFLLDRRFESIDEALEVFEDDPLLFEPDTDYGYSSYGWNLLSAVIEGASGEDFVSFMRGSVLDPLGLEDTRVDDNRAIVEDRSEFYMIHDGELQNALYVDNSVKWAGGGYLSTMQDLLDFGEALLDGKLIREETRDLLWTPRQTKDGRSTGYGVGWTDYSAPPRNPPAADPPEVEGVDRDRLRRHRIVGHGGGSMGGITAFLILPESGIVAAAHSNTSGVDALGRDLYLMLAAAAVDLAEAE